MVASKPRVDTIWRSVTIPRFYSVRVRRQNLQRQGVLLPQTDFGGFGWILSSSGQGEVEPHGHSLSFRPRLGQLTKRLRAVLCVYYVSMTVVILSGSRMKFGSRNQLDPQNKDEKRCNPAMPAHLAKNELSWRSQA